MARTIKPVLKIFSSHNEAEQSNDNDWFLASGEERLEQWSRLYNAYCKSEGIQIKDERAIKFVVRKLTKHAF